MTANQIAYAKAQEERRHNVVTERQKSSELEELQRANLERERNNRYVTEETNRHNLVSEGVSTILAKETSRSNRAREEENFRSNSQKERENYRHNRSMEDLGVYELAEKREQRQLSERQFNAQQRLREESFVWQKFLDDWNQQHNILLRDEAKRHNLAQEAIGYGNVAVGWGSVGAAQQQAAAALSNAESNRINASTNRMNVDVANRNADINQSKATVDAWVKSDQQEQKWYELRNKFPFDVEGSKAAQGSALATNLMKLLQGAKAIVGGN